MSIQFSGTVVDPRRNCGVRFVDIAGEDPETGEGGGPNMNNSNGREFLRLLGLEEDHGYGTCTIPEARRAVMKARATFDRKADDFRRSVPSVIQGGMTAIPHRGVSDPDYFRMRLDQFAEYVEALAVAGADTVTWG